MSLYPLCNGTGNFVQHIREKSFINRERPTLLQSTWFQRGQYRRLRKEAVMMVLVRALFFDVFGTLVD